VLGSRDKEKMLFEICSVSNLFLKISKTQKLKNLKKYQKKIREYLITFELSN
jgi:hypothetical protein